MITRENSNELFDALVTDALAHPIQGWDFSYVFGRYISEDPPWAYGDNILPYIERACSMLDVDTGGGEFLLALHRRAKHWPAYCWAIEAYAPNVSIAATTLSAIQVQVVGYQQDTPLPFVSATQTDGFDLIINRHGTLIAHEFARILKPGGHFVTQQVGGEMNIALNQFLDGSPPEYERVTLDNTLWELQAAGFEVVVAREAKPAITFSDIGAIVWYLQSVPWQIPGFTVEQYEGRLRKLHEQIQATGPVQSQGHVFYIEAKVVK